MANRQNPRMQDMFLFVNPKSGGNKGKAFMEVPQPFVTDLQSGQQVSLRIFSLLEGEPGNKPGFIQLRKALQMTSPIRVVVGGGDGTIMWVDSEAEKHGIDSQVHMQYGVIPLGTGNDFSRVAGWGGKNPSKIQEDDFAGLRSLVRSWACAQPRPHDVWQVTMNVNESGGEILIIDSDKEECSLGSNATSMALPMINYFSIGQESKVGMEFDKHRTKSQTCNLFVYAFEGLCTEMKCDEQQHVGNIVAGLHMGTSAAGRVVLDCRGEGSLPEIVGNPESLMFLNINSYAGGNSHFWAEGTPCGVDPEPDPESIDVPSDPGDGRIEVVTLPNIADIPLDRLEHHAKRICSGAPWYIDFFEDDEDGMDAFCEVDGEFYHLINPTSITLGLKKRLQVLQKAVK